MQKNARECMRRPLCYFTFRIICYNFFSFFASFIETKIHSFQWISCVFVHVEHVMERSPSFFRKNEFCFFNHQVFTWLHSSHSNWEYNNVNGFQLANGNVFFFVRSFPSCELWISHISFVHPKKNLKDERVRRERFWRWFKRFSHAYTEEYWWEFSSQSALNE